MRIIVPERLWLGVIIVLICGSATARGDEPSLASAFPEDALAYVELEQPASWLEGAFESSTWKTLLDSKGYAALRQSDAWPKVLVAWRTFERVLGAEGPAALERLFGNGLALALYPPEGGRKDPHVVAILESTDPTLPQTLLDSASLILRLAGWLGQGNGPKWLDAPDGQRTLQVGEAFVRALDARLVIASSMPRLEAVARHLEGQGGALAQERHYRDQRRERQKGTVASLIVYTGRLSAAGRLVPERLEEPLISLLFGGLLEAGARSDVVSLDVVATRQQLEIRGVVPLPPNKLSESVRQAFATEGKPGLQLRPPADPILALRARRDLASWWAKRGELLDESVQRGFIEFSNVMSLLFAGSDFGREILPDFGTDWELWLTKPSFAAGEPRPDPLYPAGYLTVPVLRPDAMRNALRGAFQTAIGITNAQRAQEGLSGLMLETDVVGETKVQWAEFLPESTESGRLPALHNLSPASALLQDRFVLSSSASLLKSVVEDNQKALARETQPWFELSIWSRPLVELLAENRAAIVANSVLNEGKEESIAERDVDILFELAGLLESLELRAEPDEQRWNVSLIGRWAK